MKRLCFVILHFNTTNDTIECVNSILNLEPMENISIIIVDNGSKNNSFEILKQQFNNFDRIFILYNDINLGFARGNNIGFKYAKEMLGADCIIVLNNDVIIEQSDFVKKVKDIYIHNNFFVLGPDIISIDGKYHQNPLRREGLTKDQTKKMISESKRSYIYSFIKRAPIVHYLKKKLIRSENRVRNESNNLAMAAEDVVLHGAGIIFSKLYIDKFDDAFFPKTFLYAEEDILYLRCKKYNLKVLYDPAVQIIHKEDVTTNSLFNSTIKKERFILKNRIKSLKILNELMEDCTSL